MLPGLGMAQNLEGPTHWEDLRVLSGVGEEGGTKGILFLPLVHHQEVSARARGDVGMVCDRTCLITSSYAIKKGLMLWGVHSQLPFSTVQEQML